MTALAPIIESYFVGYLNGQRQASPATVAGYRDSLRLLACFAGDRLKVRPSALNLEDIDADMVVAFLGHLETDRGSQPRTRNNRLAAIRGLFAHAGRKHPECSALIERVLAIPQKRYERALVDYLDGDEVEALLAACDRTTAAGRRDHAVILLAVETGLRVAELRSLRREDVVFGAKASSVRCLGKGRKQRAIPLRQPLIRVLELWCEEIAAQPQDPLFPSPHGGPVTSRAIQKAISKRWARAAETAPSLGAKSVSPHTLRHTCAMRLLEAGVDLSTIAIWLGHTAIQTTTAYLHADLRRKEQALAKTAPPNTPAGRFQPDDELLAFLRRL